MISFDWQILKNGNDIRGVANDGIIGEKPTMTVEKVTSIGQGFVRWLRNKNCLTNHRIAIGMDCRITSPMFMTALEESITAMGCDVLNCGLSSTPAMMASTNMDELNIDAAIMITGSHLPFNRNGLKFFYNNSGITKDELSEILLFAALGNNEHHPSPGNVHIANILALYSLRFKNMIIEHLAEGADDAQQPLKGLKIVVDAGNGVGAFFARRVLKPLGADISDSQFLIPDGRFPNHKPNPEDYEAMRSIVTAVNYAKADLGILFDADVDRVAIVDNEGRAISRNELVALAAAMVLEEHPGSAVVTDSITSTGLGHFITNILGGTHIRYQRGYNNVINEAKRLNDNQQECWLAVETSGHVAFKENAFSDDGAYFATKLIIKLAKLKRTGQQLYSLIEQLPVPMESTEIRLNIHGNDFSRIAHETLSGLRQFVTQIKGWVEVNQNYEGLRVMCNNEDEKGWFLIRLSLHDPVMPLNIETDITGGTTVIINKLKMFFRNVSMIDSTALYK